METLLENNIDFLKYLSVSSPKHRKLLIENSTNNQLDVICALFFNLLNGALPINKDDLRAMSSFEKTIHLLADKTVGRVEKRSLLIKKQGLLSSFLKTVLPIIRL